LALGFIRRELERRKDALLHKEARPIHPLSWRANQLPFGEWVNFPEQEGKGGLGARKCTCTTCTCGCDLPMLTCTTSSVSKSEGPLPKSAPRPSSADWPQFITV
jgi:hypothetical protein